MILKHQNSTELKREFNRFLLLPTFEARQRLFVKYKYLSESFYLLYDVFVPRGHQKPLEKLKIQETVLVSLK